MCGPPTTRTILLVDHESALMKLMKALLDGAGFRVLAATCAREALEICRQTKVDLLLTDVSLPDLTGRQLAMHVANFAPDVRVLYMSGSDAESLGEMGLSSTDPRLLRKPFSPAALLNAVDGALDLFPPATVPLDPKSHREYAPTATRATLSPPQNSPPSRLVGRNRAAVSNADRASRDLMDPDDSGPADRIACLQRPR
jgi:CheY-like chemotaxis protein